MSVLPSALGAAARGFPVIFTRLVLKDGKVEKVPTIRSAHPVGDPQRGRCRGECGHFGHGIYDATADEERVLEMHALSRNPNGYAVACGREPHRILGVDLDVKNGHDGSARLAEVAETIGFEMPDTIRVKTPNGWHVWLGLPPGARVRNSVGKLGTIDVPRVDLRSLGGQLVGPGSRGPAGDYRLDCAPDAPLAPVPDKLLALVTMEPARRPTTGGTFRSARSSKRVDAVLALVIAAQVGTRNDTLFRAACGMREIVADGEIPEADAWDRLLRAADHVQLDRAEADRAIRSAFTSYGR